MPQAAKNIPCFETRVKQFTPIVVVARSPHFGSTLNRSGCSGGNLASCGQPLEATSQVRLAFVRTHFRISDDQGRTVICEFLPSCTSSKAPFPVEQPQARGDYLLYSFHDGRQNFVGHNFVWMLG